MDYLLVFLHTVFLSLSLCLRSPATTVDIVMQEQLQCLFEPMNQDTLEAASPADNSAKTPSAIFLSVSMDDQEPSSTCLTPVSSGMDLELDISMVANKGSMTLSVDVCEDRQLIRQIHLLHFLLLHRASRMTRRPHCRRQQHPLCPSITSTISTNRSWNSAIAVPRTPNRRPRWPAMIPSTVSRCPSPTSQRLPPSTLGHRCDVRMIRSRHACRSISVSSSATRRVLCMHPSICQRRLSSCARMRVCANSRISHSPHPIRISPLRATR